MRLGAYNLTAVNETDSVQRKVTDIFVHPYWKANKDKYDADLAILVLSENVTFTDYIQPVCMPANDAVMDDIIMDVTGTVVGWGTMDDGSRIEIPSKIVTKSLNYSHCSREHPSIVNYLSIYSFCAQSEYGTPVRGDSGGGLFHVSRSSWVQYGIISALHNETDQSTTNLFALYTNVKMLKGWIVEAVTQSGSEIGESTNKINETCLYAYTILYGYACVFNDLDIRSEHLEIESVDGFHIFENDNDEVEAINFNSGFIIALPNGLERIFKNVRHLKIGNLDSSTLGFRHIRRQSVKHLEHLNTISVGSNNMEVLDKDCLWDLPNLTSLMVIDNKLKTLHARTFEKSEILTRLVLNKNKLETLPGNLFKNNLLLEVLDLSENSLTTIGHRIFENNINLQAVSLSGNSLGVIGEIFETNYNLNLISLSSNQLQFLPRNLFQNIERLERIALNDNLLKELDGKIFESNSNLKVIFLSSNQLQSLPKNLFKNNSLLEIIDLSQNVLKTIDEDTFEKNTRLVNVSLSSNHLEVLPRFLFKNNLLLDTIVLADMFISSIDEHFFETNVNLRVIDLSQNQLLHLPGELFKNNLLLELVKFNSNSLKTIDGQIFETNPQLREVFLSHNQIEYLPNNLFIHNLLLDSVSLSNNALTELDEEIFTANSKLTEVYLSLNQLRSLPRNLFKNNFLLTTIDFSRNSLKFIEVDFTELKNVTVISLYSNACMNAMYNIDVDDSKIKYLNHFKDLQQFQGFISINCSSTYNTSNW